MTEVAETTRTNTDFAPYKEKAFEAFILWLSLPSVLKRPPAKASISEFATSMGIDDEEVLGLIEIKTQKQFAERYEVNEDTLTAWKRTGQAQQAIEDLQRWARPLTKNVLFGLYNQCIRGGQPQHYKLWYQIVAGWSEKLTLMQSQRRIKSMRVLVLPPAEIDLEELNAERAQKKLPPLAYLKKRA